MAYKVGVNVVEGVGASPISGISTIVSGIMGTFEKGAINKATLVTGMASFEREFGSNPVSGSNAFYSVKSFFQKVGSAQLYIVRAVSALAAKATVTLEDIQSSPDDTLRVDAKNEGDWGESISVDVDAVNKLSTTLVGDISSSAVSAVLTSVDGIEVGSFVEFDDTSNTEYVTVTQIDVASKTIYWSGGLTNGYAAAASTVVTQEFELKVYFAGILVETWENLTMHTSPTFYAETVINGTSNYITVTDLESTATDYEMNAIATAATQSLINGNDGLSDIDATDYQGNEGLKTGVYAFDAVDSMFRFALADPLIVGGAESDIIALMQSMLDYCDSRTMIQFYGDIPNSKTPAQAVTFAANFAGRQMSLWYPYGIAVVSGQNKEVPTGCAAMAAAVAKDYTRGVFKNVGNEKIAYFTDLTVHVTTSDGETLNDAGVNTIRRFSGQGIKTYGGRTQSSVTAWRFLNWSEYFNYVGRTLRINLIDVPFEPNNEMLWKSVLRRVNAFMDGELTSGAITAYSSVMDGTNNPQDQIANGIAMLDLEYVPTGVAEKFVVKLTSSPAGLTIVAS